MQAIRNTFSVLAFPLIFGAQMVYAYQVVGEGRHPAGFLFPVSYLTIAVLEWVFTFEPRWRNYWRDLLPDSIFMMLGNVVRGIADPLMASVGFFVAAILAGEAASGESSGIWPHESPLWLQWMLALMIAELGQYWAHRAGHEIEFFWRFHSVHHSSAQLYFLNAARFHPIDALWLSVCSTLPLLMLGASREVLILVGSFSLCHGVFQHSNLILKLGPLNQFFSMTELHRWHHSGVIEEANTNYGTNLILWDTILGTRFLPDRRPPADIGVHDPADFPTGFAGPLIAPFQWKRLKTDPKAAGRIARIIGIGLLVIWVLSTVGSLFYLQTLANAPMPVFAVERSIEIEASPAVVWEVLMDFEAYPDWNPYAVGIEGIAEPGEVISLTIVQGNWDEPRTVKPKLVSVESQKKLAWHGTTMMTGLLETDHYFELTELGAGRTRLRQVEEFRGWIARTMNDENRRHTGASFEAMNEALAKRAEGVKR